MHKRQRELLSGLVAAPVRWDHPLRDYTSFRIGGPAQALVEVRDEKELAGLLRFLEEHELAWRVIGRGTNLLVPDHGFDGVVLLLAGAFKDFAFDEGPDEIMLRAGSACGLSRLSALCEDGGFGGLEFATGIPGSIGGGVLMNAGAHGRCIADVVCRIDVVTAAGRETYRREDVQFSYRRTIFPMRQAGVVVGTVMQLCRRAREEVRATCDSYRKRRAASQPAGVGNAGSIFKNPQGDSAGRLIEASGLKGVTVGRAQVSPKHANFIVNLGGATAVDVLDLIALVRDRVERDSGILLEPEVHIL